MIRRRGLYSRGRIYKTDKMTLTLDGTHTTDLTWTYQTVSIITGKVLNTVTKTIPAGATTYEYEFPKYCANKYININKTDLHCTEVFIEGDLVESNFSSTTATGGRAIERITITGTYKFGTNMHCAFYVCRSLKEITVGAWDTSACTGMIHMFNGCSSLTTLDVSGWDTSACTGMSQMFNGCSRLSKDLDLSKWKTPVLKGNLSSFISAISNRKDGPRSNIVLHGSPDGFDTSRITGMSQLLTDSGMTRIDLSYWDTSAVTNFEWFMHWYPYDNNKIRGATKYLSLAGWTINASMWFAHNEVSGIEEFLPPAIINHNFNITGMISIIDKQTTLNSILSALQQQEEGVTRTLQLPANMKSLLTDEQKADATAKGWTIA